MRKLKWCELKLTYRQLKVRYYVQVYILRGLMGRHPNAGGGA